MARHLESLLLIGTVLVAPVSGGAAGDSLEMPGRGICAHRGASETYPENTLAALREAVRLGAHMVEFDVRRTRDGHVILMHDATVDRTTSGSGAVANRTFAELRQLDAGSWKDRAFAGELIPTLDEALAIMPENVWLNVHLKGDAALAEAVARRIVRHDRLHQAFLACGAAGARAARRVSDRIKICNMDRPATVRQYAEATIDVKADFIQLLARQPLDLAAIERLRRHEVRINYCCTDDPAALHELLDSGIGFVLVDHVETMLAEAERLGIARLVPVFRNSAP